MKKGLIRVAKWIFKGVPTYNIKASVYTLNPAERLKGKRIVITGGGRGLGFYIAKRCKEEGASVLIVGRDEQILKKASVVLEDCPYIIKDLQDVNNFAEFVNEAANKLGGGIDCLVNNAGISLHEQSYFDVTIDTFDRQFNCFLIN